MKINFHAVEMGSIMLINILLCQDVYWIECQIKRNIDSKEKGSSLHVALVGFNSFLFRTCFQYYEAMQMIKSKTD